MMNSTLHQKLVEIISGILEVDPELVDENTHFGEYGFESVTLTQFAERVSREFGVSVNPTELYQFNTVAAFSEYLTRLANHQETGAPHTGVTTKEIRGPVTEADLIRIASEIIGVPENEFHPDDHFGDLGYESVTLGELAEKVTMVSGIEVNPAILYEKNTIRELAGYLNFQLNGCCPSGPRETPFDRFATPEEEMKNQWERKLATGGLSGNGMMGPDEDIAVIGMAGMFPQAGDLDEFWSHLKGGHCVVGPIPDDRTELIRWRRDLKAANPEAPEPEGGFMKEVDKFDPLLFNISPTEAEYMDPQQRLFLEMTWNALEDAGYCRRGLAGSNTGVFVGISSHDYTDILMSHGAQVNSFTATGNAYSILANRISYFFDWRGPSQAVDTACSSSLVALHYAIESIRRGLCDMAVAGGVNVLLSPAFYRSFMDAGMLSPTGRCRTFDAAADGYVRGEGVAALVLKPLSKALHDGDPIHGVIKSSAVNHGGRSHSLTAPNPESQAELLLHAYRSSGFDPSTIGYIEAHGTGTKLGDPIEIQGLKKAFETLYQDWGYLSGIEKHCGIGSVKTNIGHLEAAAGIAGIFKVLLAMKHGVIPPTVNFNQINPYIKLEETPFYIVDQLKNWEPVRNAGGDPIPRRAGVSSFGFGGANAHIVLEEFTGRGDWGTSPDFGLPDGPELIVLSARTKERLSVYISKIASFLEGKNDIKLKDLAFTLQTGREPLEERLALVVSSVHELRDALILILKESKSACPFFQGNVNHQGPLQQVFGNDEGTAHLRQLFEHRKLDVLGKLWVEGVGVDWESLYGSRRPKRLSLPGYPFAKQRYWVTPSPGNRRDFGTHIPAGTCRAILHPLLHQNSSDFFAQRFSSIFQGGEFFLNQYRVKGHRVLPGVAYLEMARAAFEYSAGTLSGSPGLVIKNMVWRTLLMVDTKPVPVHIRLAPAQDEEISFEIYSEPATSDKSDEPVIYGQGLIVTRPSLEAPGVLPLAEIQQSCNRKQFSAAEYYRAIEAMGINLGPEFRIIETIYRPDTNDCNQQILARLVMPESLRDSEDNFWIHPGIVDGALQAGLGFMMGAGDDGPLPTFVPFLLNELQLFQKPEPNMWAYLRSNEGGQPDPGIRNIDIDLCNDRGIIAMRFKGLSFVNAGNEPLYKCLLFEPRWLETPVIVRWDSPEYQRRLVIFCELGPESGDFRSLLESRFPGIRCLWLDKGVTMNIGERFTGYGISILEAIQEEIGQKQKLFIQILIPSGEDRQVLAGFSGMIKTVRQEYSWISAQVIETDDAVRTDDPSGYTRLADILAENAGTPDQDRIRYRDGKRWVPEWREYEPLSGESISPWRPGGIYLITGGTGGLGILLAREIFRQNPEAVLILTARSLLRPEAEEKIRELQASGANIQWYPMDVTAREQVEQCLEMLQERFGTINGIFHCAGIIRDNYIHNKTTEEFKAVLAPKVSGLVNLDEASRNLELDFMVLFSSVASVLGSPGQVDYSLANAFMDEYAVYRNRMAAAGLRHGKTIAIHWPLWKEGGMQIPEENLRHLWETTGMAPMDSADGLAALHQGLSSGREQLLVLSGNLSRIKTWINRKTQPESTGPEPEKPGEPLNRPVSVADPSLVIKKLKELLKQRISELLKLEAQDINPNMEFSSYGFDSITLTQFANRLNKEFSIAVMPTIFFDHSTLDQFAEYLAAEYPDIFQTFFKIDNHIPDDGKSEPVQMLSRKTDDTPQTLEPRLSRNLPSARFFNQTAPVFRNLSDTGKPEATDSKKIAIIGVSGRFPMADDLDQFWENLRAGTICISEIPIERWDWRKYYGDPAKEPGKSNIKWGGFINGVDEFDPLFFGISPKEAELMDPQQRLLMMYVWKCIEDAGYAPQSLSETKTAVLVGTTHCGYTKLITQYNIPIETYTSTGTVPSVGPNRMSYLLNLHGPSEPVETACSSSLVAIHRAVGLLQNGSCQLAIAGGVNTILTPDYHISFSQAGILAEDGLCKTFSDKADGYVRSEGVGMLLLKPLEAAERDGDHIYGVILGSAENHGGRANSLTAPNPKAQAELLKEAYRSAGVDPRTVTYIEAHGTGTKLGDPVEVEGLKTAFSSLFHEAGISMPTKAYCGLGSVKTNIGHLELSAGVAGIIKVLLQLKHKTLVRSLNCEPINPYIQLEGSPFYIVRENQEWRALEDEHGQILPRRAGVSSFSFSGVNSHVVLEEYIPRKTTAAKMDPQPGPVVIVLSAKNEIALEEMAKQLLRVCETGDFTNDILFDMAYTLQVGREIMEERLALVVNSLEELIPALRAFLNGTEPPCPVFRGTVSENREHLNLYLDNPEGREYIEKLYKNGKLETLARLWTEGAAVPWELIHKGRRYRRISLPTYPFAREHYWLPVAGVNDNSQTTADFKLTYLHPLLHRNTSDLTEQRFSSTFSGRESFLSDYPAPGQKVFPAAIALEMARAAVAEAMGVSEDRFGIRLKNIQWNGPTLAGDEPVPIHIGLFPEDNGEIAFEIYGAPPENPQNGGGALQFPVYGLGQAALIPVMEAPVLDLNNLPVRCTGSVSKSEEVYQAFRLAGLDHGPAYRSIETLYLGPDQVLAKLYLPEAVAHPENPLALHPGIIDGAMQGALRLMMNLNRDYGLFLPYSWREIEITGPFTAPMWAWVRMNRENNTPYFDIDLCNETGHIRASIKRLEFQAGAKPQAASPVSIETALPNGKVAASGEVIEVPAGKDSGLMTFEEVWQEAALADSCPELPSPAVPKTLVCFLSRPEYQQAMLASLPALNPPLPAGCKVIFIARGDGYQNDSPERYTIAPNDGSQYQQVFQNIRETGAQADTILYLWPLEDPAFLRDYSCIFHMLQALNAVKQKTGRILLAAEYRNDLERSYPDSWIGFERSLGMVLPDMKLTVIHQSALDRNPDNFMQDWLAKLNAELMIQPAQSVLYQNGKRLVCRIRPISIPDGNPPFKFNGTYLITGGCGGLGFLFAQHLAGNSRPDKPVNLILTGRSPLDNEKLLKIKRLEAMGSRVVYLQAGVSNLPVMKEGLSKARESLGAIRGVIHAAGIVDSRTIFEKEAAGFQAVLEPKIQGTLTLDELLQEDALDFICYFSSSSAVLGDFGACDYAVANRFLTAYTRYRAGQSATAKQRCRTVAVNWPLWKEGGMGFDDDERTRMYLQSSGQRFFETEEGLKAFDRILAQNSELSPAGQYLVMVGRPDRVHDFLGLTKKQPVPSPELNSGAAQAKALRGPAPGRRPEMKGYTIVQCLEWDLKALVNRLLRIPRDKIDLRKNLADFGFTSLNLSQLAIQLIKYYGIEDITPALFFKYPTLEKLIQYFMTEHQAVIQEFYQEDSALESAPGVVLEVESLAKPPLERRLRRSRFMAGNITEIAAGNLKTAASNPECDMEPIAIIGMSGRFPGARNIDQLWTVLASGQDMVGEIPMERFDWREYYDPVQQPGKTTGKWCGCIPGAAEFDPLFFEISPREAEIMDPRQRLLLQEAWNALEDAGYGPRQLKNQKIGMFVGVEQGDYQLLVKDEVSVTSNHNGILASRLAYFLNLNGPVMAIDTACSSGLVATHQAVMSLRGNECDTAIAAGVNLLLTPALYIIMSQAGMLSPDGKCYAFAKQANGLVPGEAVAVLVLKRLSKARADGDPVYAVIKGSGINYDGKTNGITAPNGLAQTNLLKTIYDQYRVNPEEIEYIVTHGTGTKLGDPVEINALYDAFKGYTRKQAYCALTSTKTNLGHSFAASGIVSLISLVQALRHGMIPASLNCEEENDYINWKESPFYVNKANRPWSGATRTGAVSAFGMSGTNAHVVVQSYNEEGIETEHPKIQPSPWYLLALSAKTREALEDRIKNLLSTLQNRPEQDLARISYTLLEGRHHFEYRAAMVIRNREDAVYVLQQAGTKEKLPNLFRGKVPRDFTGQKTIAEYAQDLLGQIEKEKANPAKIQEILLTLADLYCQGYELDWQPLFGGVKPPRIHLPGYPFARESYWIADRHWTPELRPEKPDREIAAAGYIHPLIHENTSDILEQRYHSLFTGREFFLDHHRVQGRRILPGMAYLEMAREAVARATRTSLDGGTFIRLENVVWIRPIVVDQTPVHVHIRLIPEEDGSISYEIYSSQDAGDESGPVHSQGRAVLIRDVEIPRVDLHEMRADSSCHEISSGQCYEIFRDMGFDYGPGFQGIDRVYAGSDRVLAKLELPPEIIQNGGHWVLHPGIMDSALQAAVGFFVDSGGKLLENSLLTPMVPFALEDIEIFGPCTPKMWAVLQYRPDNQGRRKKLNVDLCDRQGTVMVRMKGYITKMLGGEAATTEIPPVTHTDTDHQGMLLLKPVWREQNTQPPVTAPVYEQYLAIFCEFAREQGPAFRKRIEALLEGIAPVQRYLALHSNLKSIEKRFFNYAAQVLAGLQKILNSRPTGRVLIQLVAFHQSESLIYRGILSLLKTAGLENPKITVQFIEVESGQEPEKIAALLKESRDCPGVSHIQYQNGRRLVLQWDEVEMACEDGIIPWKDGGCYLITGGAGGLGLIFAGEITRRVKNAKIILCGRSLLNRNIRSRLKEIEENDAVISYKPVDITQKKAVEDLIQSIRDEFGPLCGVIHAAGIVRDNFIIRKTAEEFEEVLAPKVAGLVNLSQACRDLPLDFFVVFSSIAGIFGNQGQADYATANAFMDAYLQGPLMAENQCWGRILSLNWPLWKDGGMRLAPEMVDILRQTTGMTPLETNDGIRAFYQSLAAPEAQIMVLYGALTQLRRLAGFRPLCSGTGHPAPDEEFYEDMVRKIADGEISLEQVEAMLF